MNNVIEFEASARIRGLMFGPYGYLVSCREDGCSMSEFLDKVTKGKDELASVHFLYGAAVFYCKHKKTKVDFGPGDVMDWMYELGTDKLKEIIVEAFKIPEQPKNSSSPRETGETILSKT